jgi:glycosyltransferase involved in cell wall biosynthesis
MITEKNKLLVLTSTFPRWDGDTVEQKNVRQIAYGTIYLLDNPDNLKSFGKAGRKYVLERYDWDITENKYYDLFEKLEQRE